MNSKLDAILEASGKLHGHVCPRQVLGARMGLLASSILDLPLHQKEKNLMVFVETDGCFADGIVAATGCSLGHRTMRLIDVGRVAATFVDVASEQAVRIAPHPNSRKTAIAACPDAESRWHAYLQAYQTIPDEQLLTAQRVTLSFSIHNILSRPDAREICHMCGEEIINEREVHQDGKTLCRVCAGDAYYDVSR